MSLLLYIFTHQMSETENIQAPQSRPYIWGGQNV